LGASAIHDEFPFHLLVKVPLCPLEIFIEVKILDTVSERKVALELMLTSFYKSERNIQVLFLHPFLKIQRKSFGRCYSSEQIASVMEA
jgi:hypothetical protein